MKNKSKSIFYFVGALLMLLLIILFIIDTTGISKAVYDSLINCIVIIIPSLFAFMVLSSFIISTGLYKIIFNPLIFILKKLLKINEHQSAIFILSILGGYPIGAKLISQSLKDNTLKEAEARKMMSYCYAAGPSFITAIVGTNVFGSIKAGIIIYLSNILACFIMAFFINIKNKPNKTKIKTSIYISEEKLITAIISSAKALFEICALIVGFSIIIRIISYLPIKKISDLMNISFQNLSAFIASLTEISNISTFSPNINLLPMLSALLSFGGICVLMQVKNILKNNLIIKTFIIYRIICAALSALFTYIYIKFANPVITTSNEINVFFTQARSIIPSICLIFMTIIFLISLKPEHFK